MPVGGHTRVRVPQVGDEFFLGQDNFTAAPGTNKYAVPAANGAWTAQATAATSGLCLKIETVINKITGQVNEGNKYFCTVVSI